MHVLIQCIGLLFVSSCKKNNAMKNSMQAKNKHQWPHANLPQHDEWAESLVSVILHNSGILAVYHFHDKLHSVLGHRPWRKACALIHRLEHAEAGGCFVKYLPVHFTCEASAIWRAVVALKNATIRKNSTLFMLLCCVSHHCMWKIV